MLASSDYWQPDKQSIWQNKKNVKGQVALAKAQLFNTSNSIVDEVYSCKKNNLSICANTRLDNRNWLIGELSQQINQCALQTKKITDSQLILMAYIRWNKSCVNYFKGDFVFIIWDDSLQAFFCGRDHFGVKSLFYALTDDGIMISNEHNAFFTANWFNKKQIDEQWLIEKLWGLGPRQLSSPCSAIKTLPPAHCMVINRDGVFLSQYWSLKTVNTWQGLSERDLIIELKSRFKKAVESRVLSEYPIGAELSEGLDSNGIVGFAAKFMQNQSIMTFSYQCERLTAGNSKKWERTYRDIFDMINLHKNLQPVWHDLNLEQQKKLSKDCLSKLFNNLGLVVPSLGLEFVRLSLAEKNNIRTLLSGWGGDHCATTYGDSYFNELAQSFELKKLWKVLHKRYLRKRGGNAYAMIIQLLIKNHFPYAFNYYDKQFDGLTKSRKQRVAYHFLNNHWIEKYNLKESFLEKNFQTKKLSTRSKEKYELFNTSLQYRLMTMEMSGRQHRLEYRFPMLDIDLVEFVHSLPGYLKIKNGIERYPFRKILKGYTTEKNRNRKKSDVNHPIVTHNELAGFKSKFEDELKNSQLIKQYSCLDKLKKCLSANDPILNNNLSFLLDLEREYYLEMNFDN
ncbi:asparagine synthase-related protein [Aliikangiella maris]